MRTTIAIISICLFLSMTNVSGQALNQAIRGTITDQESMVPLPGATVLVEGSEPLIGTTTDIQGNFVLEGVPVGRHTITVSYIGYETMIIPEIMLTSATMTFSVMTESKSMKWSQKGITRIRIPS